jgi:hypothetical protein
MKFGTFLLGGLAGAAVVMLMRSRTMAAMSGGMGQMWKPSWSGMKENLLEKGLNVKFGSGSASGSFQSKNPSSPSNAGGLEEVGRLASKDPGVKHQVNEILHENGQQHQV